MQLAAAAAARPSVFANQRACAWISLPLCYLPLLCRFANAVFSRSSQDKDGGMEASARIGE